MSHTVVIDASFALKLVLQEPHSEQATALLKIWQAQGLRVIAPSLLSYEAVNVLHKWVGQGLLEREDSQQALQSLLQLRLTVHLPTQLHQRALELAHQLRLTATYDAHYLTLAEHEGSEYWTADERLWNTVKTRLPWVHWVGEPGFQASPSEYQH